MPVSDWKVVGPRLLLREVDTNAGAALVKSQASSDEYLTRECEVVGIGMDYDDEKIHIQPSSFRIGQHVYIGLYKGAKVEIDGEELIVVDAETDVLLVRKDG